MTEEAAFAFDDSDLLPAIAQDVDSGDVLMLAYVSPEAVEQTVETGLAHYYSRSRDELWKKGDTSGHVQHVQEVRVDCDGDAFLYLVKQEGGACHTGYESCFYRQIEELNEDSTAETQIVAEKVFDPEEAYE
ncbi:phosphoribosyl-AMP cyclohydrolase [Haladaptatus pallidirubidus]|uniref:Phosphoribosyl-AMP cyclohydrolase n=1 Tax=Haladaptatus pallidirubidus TaxID=1008152 RepID=A0AAV3UGS0_9EURY|nr:phosphoribosyl-AMP cyclohydrolase [Haladaptatus pallidirubidus]